MFLILWIILFCFKTTFVSTHTKLLHEFLYFNYSYVNHAREKRLFHFINFAVTLQSVNAVRIINLRIPTSYVLDMNVCRPLILDCDFEFHPYDVGFVLKWYHNNHLIYQWIPPRKPYSFVSF